METIREAVNKNGGKCKLAELLSPYGHDAFLIKEAKLEKTIFEILT
jgi:homoserine acetyltransferase